MSRLMNFITAGIIGLSSLFPMPSRPAAEPVKGNIVYFHDTQTEDNSYPELNAFYNLPKGVDGYTFMDFFKNGGYLGRTTLGKDIAKGIGAKVQTHHCNQQHTQTGIGTRFNTDIKNTFLSLGILPFWVSNSGVLKDNVIGDYFFDVKLPKGMKFWGFGECNFASKNKPQWGYGEVELSKKIGPGELGWNGALVNNNGPIPKVEHRISYRVPFN